MVEHECIRIMLTCDKACDVCDYDGRENECPIIANGVCEICGRVYSNDEVILEDNKKKLGEMNKNHPTWLVLKTVDAIFRGIIDLKKELLK